MISCRADRFRVRTVFVWGGGQRGVRDAEVRQLVEAFRGRLAVSMRLAPGHLGYRELAEMGVARVSIGPGLWAVGMEAVKNKMGAMLAEV